MKTTVHVTMNIDDWNDNVRQLLPGRHLALQQLSDCHKIDSRIDVVPLTGGGNEQLAKPEASCRSLLSVRETRGAE